jgi:AraC-like DNA-binding protein
MSSEYMPFHKYLTVSERDKDWQIFCIDAGCNEVPPGVAYPPLPENHPAQYSTHWEKGRILQEFQLIYITKGKGVMKLSPRSDTVEIGGGTVFMLFPGTWHWFVPDPDTGWDEHWVGFDGSYPHVLVEKGFFSPACPIFRVGFHEEILEHFDDIIEVVDNQLPGFQQEVGASIMKILARVQTLVRKEQHSSEAECVVQQAKLLFEKRKYEVIDLEAAARELSVGYTHFRKVFKDYTGLSPYQYFLQIKIRLAKTLLQQDGSSIKEVAAILNFENEYYFSRLFKKKTGLCPTEWVRRYG